jgi:hypothetical protein
MKKVFSLVLVFSFILEMVAPSMSYAIWPEVEKMRKRKKQKGMVECPDFSKPYKGAKPPRSWGFKKRNRKNNKKPKLCAPELTKKMRDIQKDIDKLEKEMEKNIEKIGKKAKKITDDNNKQSKKAAQAADRKDNQGSRINKRRNKKRTDWDWFGKCRHGKYGQKYSWCLVYANGEKHKKSDGRRGRMKKRADKRYAEGDELDKIADQYLTDEYAQKEVPKLNEIMDGLYPDMVQKYIEQYRKNNPEMEEDAITKKFDDMSIEELNSLLTKNSKYGKSFVEKYVEKNLPEVKEMQAQKNEMLDEIKNIKAMEKQLCSDKPKELRACPQVKKIFENEPTVENFEKMLKTVSGVYYSNKEQTNTNYAVITLDNVSEYNKKVKKHVANDDIRNRIDDKVKKVEKAWKNYEYNKKNGGQPGFKPKKVASACGSCSDLRKAYNKAKNVNDVALLKQLHEVDKQVKCNIVRPVQSCKERVNSVLKRNGFTYQGDPDAEDKNITFEMAMHSLEKYPEQKASGFEEAFKNLSTMFEFDADGRAQECGSCDALVAQLNGMGEFKDFENATKDGQTEVSTEFVLNDKGNQNEGYFDALKDISLKYKCIGEGDYKKRQNPSCEERTAYFRDFVKANENIEDITYEQEEVYNKNLADLKNYQQENDVNCCDDVVRNLGSEFINDANKHDTRLIRENSTKMKLAELLKCIKCGGEKDKDEATKAYANKSPGTSCAYYKKNIVGKPDNYSSGLKIDGKGSYTVGQWKENEVYTCSEGPKKSNINNLRDWETLAYSPYGKYGDLYDMKLKCFIDPEGNSVNLTCCDLNRDDPEFQRMATILKESPLRAQDLKAATWDASGTVDKMNKDLTDNKVKTFCNDVFHKYQTKVKTDKTSGWQICVDHYDNTLWKVTEESEFDIVESEGEVEAWDPGGASTK